MQRTYFLFVAALLLLHFITTSSASASVANNQNNTIDLNALLAFKSTIFDPQRIIPTNWSTSTSVCNWIGITCNARHHRVAAIDLSYMGIAGTIPPQLGNLSFLVRLNVMNNSFHGHLPTELSHLRRLKYINLEDNAFEGELPSWLGEFSALPKLTVLDIQHNQLVGPLPWDLFNLSSLQIISFTNNSLLGYLPAHICDHLPQLKGLYLSWNYFEGEIPSGIGECSILQVLSLSYNKFRGYIPKEIWNLTTLTQIILGGNDLTGKCQLDFVGNLSKLEVLHMGENRLRGPIPLKLFNSSTIRLIALTENDLSGELPSTIGAFLPNLEELYLEGNEFTGTILTFIISLTNCKHLRRLWIDENPLNGFLPKSIGNLSSSLESFHAGSCGIKNEIPSSIGNLSNLVELFFENNSLTGTFEHESRTKRIVMIVLLTSGSVILALVISIFLIRLKLRKKILAPTQNLLPMATFERVSFHELRQITNGFSESNLLGSGSFGSVYKGICENGMVWAIKVFDLQLEGAFKSFDRECEVLSCLRHRNLTRVITACSSLDFKALALEYMPNGSLEKWLHVNHHVLSIRQRLGIMIDVASGLEYLHYGYSMPIVHCDLKPSNILLDEDMVGHICDFGIAKLLGDGESVIQTKTLATFGYIAPEYGLEGLISTSSDVYSFGIILMETFTKRKPKDEMFTEELNLRRWIQECSPDSVIQVIDADLLHPEDKTVQRKIECISSILQLTMQTNYFLFVAALVLLHFIATSSASIIVANNQNNTVDLNALLAFKAAIFDPQRIIPTNWSTSTSVCNWIGITCNARHHRVAAIDLSYMGIAGTIPPELGNLSFLVRLNVMNNSFYGHLPTELSRLLRLKYINLEGNAFEGELPSWLGGLTALRYLSFRDNGFSGSLSGKLSNFTKLETISLGFNFFTGNLSEEFRALPKLKFLEIQFNQLGGPLPQALFNLCSLQVIDFTNNSLSGSLQAHICNYLPQLKGLYLSLNNFEGEIPSGIGECSRLQVLALSSNKFRGYIPKEIWNLTTLTQLYLGGNDLTGKLPTSLCFEKFLCISSTN
ncbi:unnamed protein product [Coffea canephora]|uniref:non-specific serine/threonine protein kinase n=1 Tax=Coffea canephora TaxID=49390 RepID=A0A068TX25_COFCA|nr:unnamed protein product [Coffea canephora]